MLLHLLNLYSKLPDLRNTLLKEILNQGEFQLNKYRSIAERSETQCNITCITFAIFVSISFMIFHPILGNYDNLPTIYFVEVLDASRMAMHTIVFLVFGLTIYTQLFAIFCPFYTIWGVYIHHLRMREYIEINLCKKYDNFEIINSKSEQDMIYFHLKKCIKLHLLLKQ